MLFMWGCAETEPGGDLPGEEVHGGEIGGLFPEMHPVAVAEVTEKNGEGQQLQDNDAPGRQPLARQDQ